MNHPKQVYKAVSAFVQAAQATTTEQATKAVKQFKKASKKLSKG
jgi:hypothetical protein